ATRTDTSIRVGVGCVASSKTRPRRPGGAGPGGDRPPATGQDGDREERGEPGCGPAGEGGREAGEPLARGGGRMRGCHGWLRPGRSAGVETIVVPVGPATVYSRLVRRGRLLWNSGPS